MADKIRLGFVGANVNSTWSAQSHFPALLASRMSSSPRSAPPGPRVRRRPARPLERSSPSTILGDGGITGDSSQWPWS